MNTFQQIRVEQHSTATAPSTFQRVIAMVVRTFVEDGQDFAEYALVLALVVLAGAAGYSGFGTALGTFATNAVDAVVSFL